MEWEAKFLAGLRSPPPGGGRLKGGNRTPSRQERSADNERAALSLWRRITVERLDASGAVIGLFEHFPYQQAAVTLGPGDRLVGYTDGVSEAMNPGQEEWGEQRMGDALARCDGLCAAETVRRVMAAADHFAAGAQQYDDMTLVVLRVTE
ncbi:MAG TPA: PP2C family protein-serine/threonine phosphatase [Terriglobia bacterium]|nr:PP2C family protein-serine/threonine phosphatase [Terriglobia bacterium]